MSGKLLRVNIGFVLAFHGIGHAMGIIPALQLVKIRSDSPDWLKNWSSHSWLLTGLLGESASRLLCVVLYAAALIGFFSALFSFLGWGIPHDLWRTLAIVSSLISLLTLALFWDALIFLFPHKIGALSVNVAVLVCLLVLKWPSEVNLGF